MPTHPSPLDAHLGYWLRLASNHVSHAFQRRVEARGVTVSEWVVLRALMDHAQLAPSKLADELGLTRGTISKLVDRLYAKRLLKWQTPREDRRSMLVSLTSKGRALVPVLASLADANDHAFLSPLSARERATLMATLQRLCKAHGLRTAPLD